MKIICFQYHKVDDVYGSAYSNWSQTSVDTLAKLEGARVYLNEEIRFTVLIPRRKVSFSTVCHSLFGLSVKICFLNFSMHCRYTQRHQNEYFENRSTVCLHFCLSRRRKQVCFFQSGVKTLIFSAIHIFCSQCNIRLLTELFIIDLSGTRWFSPQRWLMIPFCERMCEWH